MAWTRKRTSGKYQGLYRDHTGKVRSVGVFSHKAAARRAAEDAETDARSPGWRDPSAGLTTWGEWSKTWLATRTVEASTSQPEQSMLAAHLLPRWEHVPLCDITRHDVKAWAVALREGGKRKPSTVQRIVALFSASLGAAVDAEILPVNVASRLRLPAPQASHERFLTRTEFQAIVAELDDEYALMARLLASTGMRWGEAAGLHWSDVDLERRVIAISEAWSVTGRVMKGYPKGRRRRFVPLLDWVELPEPSAASSCGYEHALGRCRSGLVVTTKQGAVLDQARFGRAWRDALKRAGVGHARVYDLRHSYASWLLQAGVPLAEVQRLLGHESPAMTQRYAHLAEVPNAAITAALGDVMRPQLVGERAANGQQSDDQEHPTSVDGDHPPEQLRAV